MLDAPAVPSGAVAPVDLHTLAGLHLPSVPVAWPVVVEALLLSLTATAFGIVVLTLSQRRDRNSIVAMPVVRGYVRAVTGLVAAVYVLGRAFIGRMDGSGVGSAALPWPSALLRPFGASATIPAWSALACLVLLFVAVDRWLFAGHVLPALARRDAGRIDTIMATYAGTRGEQIAGARRHMVIEGDAAEVEFARRMNGLLDRDQAAERASILAAAEPGAF